MVPGGSAIRCSRRSSSAAKDTLDTTASTRERGFSVQNMGSNAQPARIAFQRRALSGQGVCAL